MNKTLTGVVMKMPAGWQNWRDYFKKHKCPYTYPGEGEELLEFMRELAEALELIDEGYHTNIQECMNYAKASLRKFKEWK